MKTIFTSVLFFVALISSSQDFKYNLFSAYIIGPDSIPVIDASIINTRSGKIVRANSDGYFTTEILEGDSLLIYHISYSKKFINKRHNGKIIMLEHDIHELMQVDILNGKEEKNLEKTVEDIKRIAPEEELTGYDKDPRINYFILQHGSHNKGFMPFFGPTFTFQLSDVTSKLFISKEKKHLKEITSHYKLVKQKKR